MEKTKDERAQTSSKGPKKKGYTTHYSFAKVIITLSKKKSSQICFSSKERTLRRAKKKKKKKKKTNVVGGGAKDAPLFPGKGGVLRQRKEVVFEEKSRERINPRKRVL